MEGFRIYIVDDDEDVRASLAFRLKAGGYSCNSYSSGVDFLADLPELERGCVLLDIRMPRLGGLEVLSEIHRMGLDWPVVMMTGHGDIALAVKAMRLGAFDFFEKPFRGRDADRGPGSRLRNLIRHLAGAVGRLGPAPWTI